MRLGIGLGLSGQRGASGPYIVLSTPSQQEGTAIGTTIGTLSVVGASTGSSGWTFAKTVDPDAAFTLTTATVKNAIVFDYDVATGGATSHIATYTATKAGDPASPITTQIRVAVTNVFEAANLAALGFSGTLTQSASSTITITSATATSTLSLGTGSLPAGMTLNSGPRTITGTPTTLGSGSAEIIETLADSANSPRPNTWNWEVVEAPDFPPANTTPGLPAEPTRTALEAA